MRYIITEEQQNRINEIMILSGDMSVSPTYKDIIDIVKNNYGDKRYYKALKEYVKNVLGYPEKFKKEDAKDYGEALWTTEVDSIPEELKNPEVLANLGYFMAKKFLKLRMLGELECYVKKGPLFGKTYYFFDPELEICVGYINCSSLDGEYGNVNLPSNTYSVTTSQVDEGLKGRGVGKQMYFAVLEDVDVLLSDTLLYTDSLNIWVNILPKYFYVGALFYDKKPKRILSKTPVLNHEEVLRYFATKNPKLIKARGSNDDDEE
jgi:ribosomal protein S18 acetylase RimI-like enzyme